MQFPTIFVDRILVPCIHKNVQFVGEILRIDVWNQ